MKIGRWGGAVVLLAMNMLAGFAVAAERLTIAAGTELQAALPGVLALYAKRYPADQIDLVFGSSGKLNTQIRNGAPFDLFFSADIDLPRGLVRDGFAVGEAIPYALGRIVLWSTRIELAKTPLSQLAKSPFTRLAIANPRYSPYGQRAEEALRQAGVFDAVSKRLVYGEDVAQTAQFALSGNAELGIIALSLALTPEMHWRGHYTLIDSRLHRPLRQGFVFTRRGANSSAARRFAEFFASEDVYLLLAQYGFERP